MTPRGGSVAFVSSEPELETLNRFGPFRQFVALTPEADWALERSERTYVTIEDLYDEHTLLERGAENIKRAKAFAAIVDRLAGDVFGDAVDGGGYSAQHRLYHLRILFDALFHRSFTIGCALDELRPDRVAFVTPAAFTPGDDLAFPPQSLSGFVLPHLAASRGIEVTQAPALAVARPGVRRRLAPLRQRARRLGRFRDRRTSGEPARETPRLLVLNLDREPP